MNKPQLRGDYSRAGLDYSVEQNWSAYTPEEHALYRRLFERQSKLVPRYACPEWISAIARLDAASGIPEFKKISLQLQRATGWEIVPVPGLCSATAAGLARRISDPQWRDVETGVARVTERMLSLLPAERSAALLDGPVTVDLDTTDVEV